MKPRVVQLIDSLSTGGAEKLLLTYARQAAARDIGTTVIALKDKTGAVLPGQLVEAGARVQYLPGRGLGDPRRAIRLAGLLRSEHADVLHAHLEYATILGALAGALAGVPVVASLHNTRPDRREMLETLALRYGTREIIAVGRTVAEANAARLGHRPITVLQNPVNVPPPLEQAQRIALRTELAEDPKRPLLVSVGRLSPQKGYADLLKAIDLLRQTHRDAFLAIVGTGRLKDELAVQIRECGLDSNVRLLGLREDVPQILGAADLYVSASLWEGLPVAVLEAMAAGLPVVATAVGDVPEILKDGRGIVVQVGQPAQLAEAAARLLDNAGEAQRIGRAAREYVSTNHRADQWFGALMQVYADVAGA